MGAKADFWRGHLAEWRSSGLTQAAYCRQHSLSVPSFGYWRRTLETRSATTSAALLPIVIGEASGEDDTIEVYLPNGLRAQVPTSMMPSRWVALIRALRTC